MAIFGNTESTSTQETTISTQTVTDSYNQAFSRTDNLSDVGNVSVSLGNTGAGLPPIAIAGLAIVGLVVWFIYKRKG